MVTTVGVNVTIVAMSSLAHTRALAEEYARQYNPKSVAPFPYENVAIANKDLEIFFTDLEDPAMSGATIYKEGKFTIVINTSKPETRQHFTLGHELGHYFLHKDVLREEKVIVDGDTDGPNMLYRMDDGTATQLEVEANNFAASLLMPADLVYKAWEATHSIEDCARIFKVSIIAMSLRLIQLGLVSE